MNSATRLHITYKENDDVVINGYPVEKRVDTSFGPGYISRTYNAGLAVLIKVRIIDGRWKGCNVNFSLGSTLDF